MSTHRPAKRKIWSLIVAATVAVAGATIEFGSESRAAEGKAAANEAANIAAKPASTISAQSKADFLNDGIDFGSWAETAKLCEQLLAKDPSDLDALTARARLRDFAGNTDGALADIEKVLKLKPDHQFARVIKAGVLSDTSKLAESQTECKIYLAATETSTDLDTLYRRAGAFSILNESDKWNALYKEIINRTDTATDTRNLLLRGRALLNNGKYKDAIAILNAIVKSHPEAPRPLALLSWCHIQNNEPDIALKQIAKVIELAPQYFTCEAAWGEALRKKSKYDDAVIHFNKAIYMSPDSAWALRQRGYCLMLKGENARSLKDLDKVLTTNPDDKEALLFRAYTYDGMTEFAKAIADCKRLILLDKKYELAYYQLAWSQAHLRDFKAARDSIDHALRLSPERALFYRSRASIATSMGNLNQAYADFAAAIKFDPKYEEVYFSRGLLYRDNKRYKESIADFTTAIKLEPTNAVPYCARGCAEVLDHQYQKAISDCTKSLSLDSTRSHPHLSRGQAYTALGKYGLALKDLNFVIAHCTCKDGYASRAKVYRKLNKIALAKADEARAK